jgi:hypothetical protein
MISATSPQNTFWDKHSLAEGQMGYGTKTGAKPDKNGNVLSFNLLNIFRNLFGPDLLSWDG